MNRFVALSWLLLASAPLSAAAQQVRPPLGATSEDYRFQVGPVGLSPTFTIDHLGIDTNATLSPDEPVRDFAMRTTPGAAYMLRMRRLRLHGQSAVSFQYYDKTEEQRSVDTLNSGQLTLMGASLEPRVFGSYGHVESRPNQEIETIVGQLTGGYGVGTDYRVSSRLVLQFDVDKLRQDFEEQFFRGALINRQLNRTSETMRGGARIGLTPITSLLVGTVNTRERFEYSPDRDAESLSLVSGVETKPSALIAGGAKLGYRRFNALDENVPDDRDFIADVAMSYTMRDRTQFGFIGRRNLEFSAERDHPYYILMSAGVSITQRLGLGWDVKIGAAADKLAYRNFVEAPVDEGRTDRINTLNGGIGRKMGDTGRIGVEIGHIVRRSPILRFSYEGWRAGVKMSYGM